MEILREEWQVNVHHIIHADAACLGALVHLDLISRDGNTVFLRLFKDRLPDLILALVVGVGVFLGRLLDVILELVVVEEGGYEHVNQIHDQRESSEPHKRLNIIHRRTPRGASVPPPRPASESLKLR